ncbi:uncharacterized protein IL334_001320 [Kwoniella shivajii]|uniref:Uncharacterized protein n=1 Tax=Kwoniella shivajii TaxID=564305 RepID=A0ABZ1CRK3_9TREE|nr:hypothetical protein IL334_001320 [Kwoniella shivajii]
MSSRNTTAVNVDVELTEDGIHVHPRLSTGANGAPESITVYDQSENVNMTYTKPTWSEHHPWSSTSLKVLGLAGVAASIGAPVYMKLNYDEILSGVESTRDQAIQLAVRERTANEEWKKLFDKTKSEHPGWEINPSDVSGLITKRDDGYTLADGDTLVRETLTSSSQGEVEVEVEYGRERSENDDTVDTVRTDKDTQSGDTKVPRSFVA